MKVGVVYEDFLGSGGYPRDIRWLSTFMAKNRIHVTVFTHINNKKSVLTELENGVEVVPFRELSSRKLDIIHIFGMFLPKQLLILVKVINKPLVISPMGHLMPFHLQRKAIKKAIYLRITSYLFKKVNWYHVFSPVEADSVYKYMGKYVNTFEAGLGVFPLPPDVEVKYLNNYKNEPLNILFFGRNDIYQKGIDILMKGFTKALRLGANATLTISGKPWGNSKKYLSGFINKENISDKVKILGPIEENAKWQLISNADYLIFLSRWDGPPRPIREAIAVGTPVIVSPETNMGHLVSKYKAGIEVPLNVEKVAQTITTLSKDRSIITEHRAGVIKLRERLDWFRVAEDYIRGYEQVLKSWK